MARMCDLPQVLVMEILTRVPITSLKAIRSTCKTWDAITKSCVLGKAEAPPRHQGFVTMDGKVYSLRFHLGEEEEEDLVWVKQVDLLNELDVSKVYHCDGLVLCIPKDQTSKLLLWNPYLSQTRWIEPRVGENFTKKDRYAIGYHKILRFVDDYIGSDDEPVSVFTCEIYEISCNSWRVLNVKPEWEIDEHQRGVSVKGNTYFFAHQRYDDIEPDHNHSITEVEDFLLSFDFTKEMFGPRLPLPFHSYSADCITLSSLHDDQLAVLFGNDISNSFQIWVTLTLDPDYVSWSKFLRVETGGFNFELNWLNGGSFFVDEENKVAVVFELDTTTAPLLHHTAFVFGEDGYFQSFCLGEATKFQHFSPFSKTFFTAERPPLVCSSSYRPSLVQLNQPSLHKRKRKSPPAAQRL